MRCAQTSAKRLAGHGVYPEFGAVTRSEAERTVASEGLPRAFQRQERSVAKRMALERIRCIRSPETS